LADLDSTLRRAPCSVVAYEGYMGIAPYAGDTAMSREAMDQALLIQPYSFVAREAHMLNLRPRWAGTYEAMEQLAAAADSFANHNPGCARCTASSRGIRRTPQSGIRTHRARWSSMPRRYRSAISGDSVSSGAS